MKNPLVIVVTGPTGAGKTTLAKILSNHYGYACISGDEIKERLFPETEDISQDHAKLVWVKEELLKGAKEVFETGRCAVVDYVILGEEYIERFRLLFGEHLIFKVILPPLKTIIERDSRRDNWTSGEDTVLRLTKAYVELKPFVGLDNYIDNTLESPQETFARHFQSLIG